MATLTRDGTQTSGRFKNTHTRVGVLFYPTHTRRHQLREQHFYWLGNVDRSKGKALAALQKKPAARSGSLVVFSEMHNVCLLCNSSWRRPSFGEQQSCVKANAFPRRFGASFC